MVALAIVLSAVVLLLALLVAGLLRSHADILKALHDLGVGVGDPGTGHDHGQAERGTGPEAGGPVRVPLTIGPPLPGERDSTSAPTVVGVTPRGDAVAVAATGGDGLTLLSFLSSGCATCAGFWQAFQAPDRLGLPTHTRLVVVTKGPDLEIPGEVAAQAPDGLPVVMSTEAWGDYEVPGSPFFVLIDGRSGRRIGEGVANHFHQVVELVRRAESDARAFSVEDRGSSGSRASPTASTVRHGSGRTTASSSRPASGPAMPASTRRPSTTCTDRPGRPRPDRRGRDPGTTATGPRSAGPAERGRTEGPRH